MNEIKQNNLEVKTRYGMVEGFSRKGCACWYGIPFAKPPVGELAFRHPEPPESWEGVRKAFYGSANPIQSKGDFSIGNNSQDCLYLNVFVPEEHTGPLPVMVWIYGGAYNQGGAGAVRKDSAELLYDMNLFARESGCAVVSFNYRQNLYGFLNLHFLDERFDQNNGLFDQIMALRFVKENIAAFGGDPDNVTLFGQSAGASSVLALMAMKEAEGLFHKAIVMSANVEHFYTEEESRRYTNDYLKFAGVSRPEKLAALSEQRVCAINERYAGRLIMKGDVRCAFSPVSDAEGGTEKGGTALQHPSAYRHRLRGGKPLYQVAPQSDPASGAEGHRPEGGEGGGYAGEACERCADTAYLHPADAGDPGGLFRAGMVLRVPVCVPRKHHGLLPHL